MCIRDRPYIGVLFKSQNASTWTPSQYEDLMFKIYRAEFTLPTVAAPSRLLLENGELGESNGGSLNLFTNPFRTTEGSDLIRVFHSNHGMQSTLNYVTISGVTSEIADSSIASANLAADGSSVVLTDPDLFHQFIGGSASGAVVECYNFDGIPLTKINKTHSSGVQSINSPHSYNLQISGVNAGTGIQGGGGNIVASQNIPWDVLTPQIQSQLEPRTSMVARVQGTSGTSCGPFPSGSSAETSFVKDSDFQDVTIGEENYFPATKIVANQINEINRMNSV